MDTSDNSIALIEVNHTCLEGVSMMAEEAFVNISKELRSPLRSSVLTFL